MTVAYRIRNFSVIFETAESRKLQRLAWLALPTKQEGDGYTELMGAHPNGCAHFGAWTAMLQLAAKCSPRGLFSRDLGGKKVAHDLGSISRITRVPVEVLREAMPRLLEMGWMEEVDYNEVTSNLPIDPGLPGEGRKKPGSTGTGQNRTGQDRGEDPPTPPASPDKILTPEEKKAERRLNLLVILKSRAVKLDLGMNNIFEEWVDETNGYHLEWIDRLLMDSRPRIKLPSKLRADLKARIVEYDAWRAKRNLSA